MVPKTGEVVAMASYPRINTNDFLLKENALKISRWLENKNHFAHLWDGKTNLEREFYSFTKESFYEEEKTLSLDHYLDRILSLHSQVRKCLYQLSTLEAATSFQKDLYLLLDLSEQPYMHALIDTLYPKEDHHHPSCFETKEIRKTAILNALAQHDPLFKELKTSLDKLFHPISYNDD